jgi:hypothetical protein
MHQPNMVARDATKYLTCISLCLNLLCIEFSNRSGCDVNAETLCKVMVKIAINL